MFHRTSGAKAIALVAVLLSSLNASSVTAQPKAKQPLGYMAIANAEKATGKKLSAAQKAQIIKAAHAREAAIEKARKAEWKKFRTTVAKTVGLSLAQMEAKEKAARGKR